MLGGVFLDFVAWYLGEWAKIQDLRGRIRHGAFLRFFRVRRGEMRGSGRRFGE